MLDELTPEQAYELFLYHFKEPFGEVRDDLRTASILQFYYDSKRGKKGRRMALGEFTLYPDIAKSAKHAKAAKTLMDQLSSLSAVKHGK